MCLGEKVEGQVVLAVLVVHAAKVEQAAGLPVPVAEVDVEVAGRRLARAIQGKGAFRHFKNELHEEYPHLVSVWYAFRDVRSAPGG